MDLDIDVEKDIENPLLSNEDIEDAIKDIFLEDTVESFDVDPVMSQYVTDLATSEFASKNDYTKRVQELSRFFKGKIRDIPKKSILCQYYSNFVQTKKIQRNIMLEQFIKLKSVRSHSGVLVITVLTSPGKFSCPKNCHYCPNEVNEKGVPIMPRSYISTEPACRRATECNFDAVTQVFSRARCLQRNGHLVDKIEILILGGTWSFYPQDYQDDFIRDLFFAANVYHEYQSTGVLRKERKSLEEEQQINETANCRVIGITIETRPDYITLSEIKRFRKLGITR